MTYTCENITFPQLLLRAVKMSKWKWLYVHIPNIAPTGNPSIALPAVHVPSGLVITFHIQGQIFLHNPPVPKGVDNNSSLLFCNSSCQETFFKSYFESGIHWQIQQECTPVGCVPPAIYRTGSLSRGSLSRRDICPGGLCPGGFLSLTETPSSLWTEWQMRVQQYLAPKFICR